MTSSDADELRAAVRDHYAQAAREAGNASCCGDPGVGPDPFGRSAYPAGDQDALPELALIASLGCGNPTMLAELRPGKVVLDLGSGGGIDVLLSARRVAPNGRVYGLDMTPRCTRWPSGDRLHRRCAARGGVPGRDDRRRLRARGDRTHQGSGAFIQARKPA